MRLSSLLLVPLVAVALPLFACGGDDDSNGGDAASDGAVSIFDFGFSPDTLDAVAGEQVTLEIRNTGNAPHTFTIDDVTDTGRLEGGGSNTARVEFTASEAGELTFYCTIHGAAL